MTLNRIYGQTAGLLILLVAVLCLSPVADAADIIDITDIRFWSYPDYTRVVITLSDTPEYTNNRLSNPDRLYFDIQNSRITKEIKSNLPVGNGMLKSIRASQFNENTVRVVLDLEKVREYKILTMEDPIRLIIDIYGGAAGPSTGAVFTKKKRIVIDPGHGGHDPGAVGPNKLYEKDVVLDIALKLRKILAADPNLEIFMTRDKDVFIPLEQRTAIANSKKADLFVSVHANASPRKAAKGIETYFLNWTSDEEALKVAARENQISLKKMKKMNNDERDILRSILGDLSRDNKRDESLKLANYIQLSMVNNLNKDYDHIVDLGVKQALFYVLFGAQMSSVLVEVSFISNPLEEKLLSKSGYREGLARSIATGISSYVSAAPVVPASSGSRKTLASRH